MLEFIDKWINKKVSANTIRAEFLKEDEITSKEIVEHIINKKPSPKLSARFQNIHIAQLVKLAEEDKRQKIKYSAADENTFNF